LKQKEEEQRMSKQQEEGKIKDEVSAHTELDRQIRGKREGLKKRKRSEAKAGHRGKSPPLSAVKRTSRAETPDYGLPKRETWTSFFV
jgi:hypothetical protein